MYAADRGPRGHFASCRATDQASKNFMARNGIWVHLAVIKRQRCKELSAANPPAQVGTFHPEGIDVRGNEAFTSLLRPSTTGENTLPSNLFIPFPTVPTNTHFQRKRFVPCMLA